MSRRRNAGPERGSDARLRATLRRFEGSQDPVDAVAFATEFIRSHGSPPDGPSGVDLIRDEYMAHVRGLAKQVVDRFDVEDGVVDYNEFVEAPEREARSDPWTLMDSDRSALQTLLVSPNALHAASEGLLTVQGRDAERFGHGPQRRVMVDEGSVVNEGGLISSLAYWALVSDMRDEMRRIMQERGISEGD